MIGYCSSEFLGMYKEPCTDTFLFDTDHTNKPVMTFSCPDHLTAVDYHDKSPSLVGAIEARCAGGMIGQDLTHRLSPVLSQVIRMLCIL